MDILFQEHIFKRPYPENYDEKDRILFDNEEKSAWSIYYDVLNKVSINYELFVKYHFKILPISFGHPWQNQKYNKPTYLLKNATKNLLRKRKKVDKLVWILDQFSTGGYYHWLTEILPRLWITNEVQRIPADIPLYFPEYFFNKWNFGHQLLEPFKRDYFTFKPHMLLKVNELHFISQPGGPIAFQPEPLDGSSKILTDFYYKSRYKHSFEKIYISRNKGNKRLLLDEEHIIPILKNKNFKIVYTEDLSVEDQINLFSRCKVLVSIHGAGLTNMIFMETGSKILEIRNSIPDHMNNCFLALAATKSLQYYYFLATTKPSYKEIRPIDYSMKLSPELFETCLDQLLTQ
jgi:capsular polysaccharide biosynthesis protein